MVATVTALVLGLVLGLLISSAKSSFDAMNARIIQMSATAIILDRTLAEYGPEAQNAREQMRRSFETIVHELWPEERTGVSATAVIERGGAIAAVQTELRQLAPQDDARRQLLAQARQLASDAAQSRWTGRVLDYRTGTRRSSRDAARMTPIADKPKMVSSDAATGRTPELAIHLRMARRQGWAEDELVEVLLHLSGCVGAPLVREARLTATETFAALGAER